MFDPLHFEYALEIQPPYGNLILSGQKSVETRRYPLPKELIGHKIYLFGKNSVGTDGISSIQDQILEGQVDLKIWGQVIFSEIFMYETKEQWDNDRLLHRVGESSVYDWSNESVVWGWRVTMAECWQDPLEVLSMTRVLRSIFVINQT